MSGVERIDGMPNREYHARPELSSSGARTILKAPALFRWQQEHRTYSDAFDLGSAAHKVVLGDETTRVVEIDAPDWRSKAAREERDAARVEGAIPLLAKDAATVRAMADAIRLHPVASALLRPGTGKPEVSVFWGDQRARFDWLPDQPIGRRLIVPDYKTAADASESAFSRAVASYGYHQQAAWYTDALTAMGAPDPAFLFIVQEKEPPYLVNVFELDPEAMAIGTALNTRALALWRQCREDDQWPGYDPEIKSVALPKWAVYEFEESVA